MKAKVIRKEQCPVCALKGLDKSKNNLAVYEDGGKFCFGACNRAISLSESYKAKLELIKEFECKELVFPVTNFTKEHWDVLKEKLTTDPKGYRGLKKSTCETYRVFHEIDAVTNKVKKQYYPISKDNKFSGIKIRQEPKAFYAEGTNDSQCDLFGQALFTQSTSKWIIYVEGELDALSAFQMLEAQRKSDFASIPVVSGTVGAGGSVNQLKNNYTFLDRFEKIILIPDQDDAGQAAIERIAQSLPKDKLYIADLPAKDANEMLMAGREKEFVTAVLWKHRHYTPAGIFGSDTIYEKILEKALVPKVAFPKFLDKLNYITGGGVQVGTINTISAGSGCVDKDTEFLSQDGWKKISDYREGDLVAQWKDEPHFNYELIKPLEYIKTPTDHFIHFYSETSKVDQKLTEEHRVLCIVNGEKITITAKQVTKLIDSQVPVLVPIVSLTDSPEVIYTSLFKYTTIDEPDIKYCFTVPSSYLILRRNGIIFITGNSGKSTLINQMVLDWINGRTAKVGIVSLEADRADYGENLLSAHIKQKLHLIDSPEAKFNLIASEAVKDAAVKLFTNDDGTPSFYIIDERGDYNALQSKIEELIISCECNVVVIDVLSDVFDTLSIDEQAKFMGWQKAICKRYGTIFFNVMHTRKPASNQKSASQGAVMTEESMMGSGTSYRSSSMIIMLARDKTAEDEVLRNMMEVHVTKNRQTGVTGNIMQLAYNLAAHQLEDASHIFEQLKEKKKEDDKPINRF